MIRHLFRWFDGRPLTAEPPASEVEAFLASVDLGLDPADDTTPIYRECLADRGWAA